MELQHLNVKLFLDSSPDFDLWEFVPVFHSWIQIENRDELLIDVADYRHVPEGPGIVLVGHDADYSIDNTENRLGLRYNRKTILSGTNQDRLSQALGAALKACERLEVDQRLKGQVRFERNEIKVFVNDRLLVPNVQSSYESIESEVRKFFADLLIGINFALDRENDPRNLFGLTLRMSREFSLGGLLKILRMEASETIPSSTKGKIN